MSRTEIVSQSTRSEENNAEDAVRNVLEQPVHIVLKARLLVSLSLVSNLYSMKMAFSAVWLFLTPRYSFRQLFRLCFTGQYLAYCVPVSRVCCLVQAFFQKLDELFLPRMEFLNVFFSMFNFFARCPQIFWHWYLEPEIPPTAQLFCSWLSIVSRVCSGFRDWSLLATLYQTQNMTGLRATMIISIESSQL